MTQVNKENKNEIKSLQVKLDKSEAKERKLVMENQEQDRRIKQLEKILREKNRTNTGGGASARAPLKTPRTEFNNTGFGNTGLLSNRESRRDRDDAAPPMPPPQNPQTMPKNASKNLTLKQLKDVIKDMYEAKVKFDAKCDQSKAPRETLEQFMYTYLNQKYGLKSLIVDWAASLIQAIKKNLKKDHDVTLFAKILKNECDEDFRLI